MKGRHIDLFLDSGAYSAWTQGVEIDIHEYIKFIKEHKDLLTIYTNLDVLPKVGDDQAGLKKSAELTLENQKIMEGEGLTPLPVFHVGQPFSFLEYYVDNYDYLGLGAMVGKPKSTLIPWLDSCFSDFICDGEGMPKIKIHGFGITALDMLFRYPWYSVDSTSWVMTGRMGSVYIPRYKNGGWVYDENSWKIAVSTQSPGSKEAGKHINTLPPRKKQIILNYIHDKGYSLGKSRFEKVDQNRKLEKGERWAEKKPKGGGKRMIEIIEEPGLCNRYELRDELNIIYFKDLEDHIPEWPQPFRGSRVKGFSL